MSRFRDFLAARSTTVLLDAMTADNARVDAALALAEHRCADDAIVVTCDGQTDLYRCLTCDRAWVQPCPDATLWQPED